MRRLSIVQGEHAIVKEPQVVVSTVLGSCISVCLHDPVSRIGGMNHFLLGEPNGRRMNEVEMQRYGVHSMEVLINKMMAEGADRRRLRAHVYGGANVVANLGHIGSRNAQFARDFLEVENIITVHEDVGGSFARRVEFLPYEGKTRCTRVAQAPLPPPAAPAPALAPAGELELF